MADKNKRQVLFKDIISLHTVVFKVTRLLIAWQKKEVVQNKHKLTSYREAKDHIKRHSKTRWLQNHKDFCKRDPFYNLSREDQVIIFRMRTGHNRMNAHLRRINLSQTDLCPCRNAPMTSDHILQDCQNFTRLRQGIWPQETPSQAF